MADETEGQWQLRYLARYDEPGLVGVERRKLSVASADAELRAPVEIAEAQLRVLAKH